MAFLNGHGNTVIVWRSLPALIFTALRNMALHYGAVSLLAINLSDNGGGLDGNKVRVIRD